MAKIAGLKMVEAYRDQFDLDGISLMPTKLYGPEDNFDLQSSHVLPRADSQVPRSKVDRRARCNPLGHGISTSGIYLCG